MPLPIRKIQTQEEKVIDYQYIRNLKNKEVRKNRFKRTLSQRIFRIFLIAALVAEISYLGFFGVKALTVSHWFTIHNVEVSGTRKTTTDEIRKLILSTQTNALLIDLTQVKLRLENHPWIESAVIWRELPATIRVHVTERKPAALVLSGNLYLVDQHGRMIETFGQEPEYASLPVVTGIPDISDEARIRNGLEYIEALAADSAILKLVSEVHYDGDSTIIYLKGTSFGLLVSKDGILPMIKKFMTYSDFVKKNFGDARLIDLRYQEQIVLKDTYREQL
jgi:POTRA domain, FtsQ-type/Cell division protein FtsQ